MSPAAVTYPFVHAHYDDYGPRQTLARALVVHMAEGGGTVGFLSRPADVAGKRGNWRKVSVHYVIDRAGVTTRMLDEERVSGSINPKALRTGNSAPFVGYNGEVVRFGATARKKALGEWDTNPNHVVITVEVEGFAAVGPNLAQRKALVLLSRDVASRYPKIRLLGHRDFTVEKACPGQFIPWANMAPTKKHG